MQFFSKLSLTIIGGFLLLNTIGCKFFNAAKDDRDFAVSDTASIQKIFIADKGAHSIQLERKGSRWMINGKYFVRKDAIANLLETIKEIKVNRPVPIEGHNAVVKDMAANAIKVELMGADDQLLKSYFVGGIAKNFEGNYFLMNGAEHPYVVEIPGFDGYLSVRYILDETDWRDRNIVSLQPSDIRSVAVQYLDERASESFELQIPNLNQFQLLPSAPINEKQAFLLLESFKNLNAINYARNRPQDIEARTKNPFAIIRLKETNGTEHQIALIHADATDRTKQQFDPNGKPMSFDSEIYYAWTDNNKDFLLIQDFMLRNILLLHKDFIK